jgi:hypothetical protein
LGSTRSTPRRDKEELNLNQELIEELFKQIIGPFAATQVSPLMDEPENSEERVTKLAETLHKFPHLIPPFNLLIKGLKPAQANTVLEEKIRFYQTKHTRNWILVNLINQILNIKELKLDETNGRLPAKPHDLLKFATQSLLAFGEESRYKDQAFAGGLLFDFLFYLQRSSFVNLGTTKFDEPINQCFIKAVEQGKLILKLSRHKPKLTLEKYALLTAFMRQLSQVSLYILKSGSAPEFYKKLSTLKLTEEIRLAMELKTFGVHTGIISSYLAQALPAFGELGQAMSVWGSPQLAWVHSHREIHDLSGIGLLGVTINERLKGADFPTTGAISPVIAVLEHLDLKLTPEVKSEAKI